MLFTLCVDDKSCTFSKRSGPEFSFTCHGKTIIKVLLFDRNFKPFYVVKITLNYYHMQKKDVKIYFPYSHYHQVHHFP